MDKIIIRGVELSAGDHILYDNTEFRSEVIVIFIEKKDELNIRPNRAVLLAVPVSEPYFTYQGKFRIANWEAPFGSFIRKNLLPDPLMAWQFIPWVTYTDYLETYFVRKLEPEEYEVVS